RAGAEPRPQVSPALRGSLACARTASTSERRHVGHRASCLTGKRSAAISISFRGFPQHVATGCFPQKTKSVRRSLVDEHGMMVRASTALPPDTSKVLGGQAIPALRGQMRGAAWRESARVSRPCRPDALMHEQFWARALLADHTVSGRGGLA